MKRGRPPLSEWGTRVVAAALPMSMFYDLERYAHDNGWTISEALRALLQRRFGE